jgi:hypothetical protein
MYEKRPSDDAKEMASKHYWFQNRGFCEMGLEKWPLAAPSVTCEVER